MLIKFKMVCLESFLPEDFVILNGKMACSEKINLIYNIGYDNIFLSVTMRKCKAGQS